MNLLIVFYSRTGNTKNIAELITNSLNCEYEEIFDTKKRTGFIIGFIKSGYAATRKKLTTLKEIQKNPELYDLIILGTPIWNKRMTPAIRTYITNNLSKFKNVAFFCTEGGKGGLKTFESMAKLCQKEPLSTLEITKKEIKKGSHIDKINKFVTEIK
ncbi:MAG: flavodoxin family protein [Promethearchaeota archaeon]|nr:MAG: flavodoxin family protein [Candidatus Lokiarchaeota archaeon]